MTPLEQNLERLPKPLLAKLRKLARRARRLQVLRGIFATLAVAVLSLLAVMAVDVSVTLFSAKARLVLSLAGLALTLAAAGWFLVRPLTRRITLDRVARFLEARHPELQERISTAVELMASDDPDSLRGSEELIAAVVDDATLDAAEVNPRTEFRGARARRFAALAGGALALLLAAFALFPHQAVTLFTRAFAPLHDLGNAFSHALVVDPGDIRVAEGSPLTITLTAEEGSPRRAELRTVLPDGTESVERMALLESGDEDGEGEAGDGKENGKLRFAHTIPKVAEDFTYRIRSGRGLTEYYEVTAVPPPVVENLTIHYDYPDYTGLESEEKSSPNAEDGAIQAVAHTRVTVAATLDQDVAESSLSLADGEQNLGPAETEGPVATWTFPLEPGMDGTWSMRFADAEGFESEEIAHPLLVLPDKVPEIAIVNPAARELRLRPTEALPLDYTATEDFGFAALDLHVMPLGGGADPSTVGLDEEGARPGLPPQDLVEISQPLPEPAGVREQWKGQAQLDLAALDLPEKVDRLVVQLRARDNRPAGDMGGPGEGLSESLLIHLDSKAPSLTKQALDALRKEVNESVQESKKDLQRARRELDQADKELRKDDELTDRARKELQDFEERARAAEERLRELTENLDGTPLDQQAAELQEIAEQRVQEARKQADMVPLADSQEDRLAESAGAREQIDEALQNLQDVEEALRDSASEMEILAQLGELANQQMELAARADDQAAEAEKQRQALAEQFPQQEQANAQAADQPQGGEDQPSTQDPQAARKRQQAEAQAQRQEQKSVSQFRSRQERIKQQLGQMLQENQAALEEVLREQTETAERLGENSRALAQEQEELRQLAAPGEGDPEKAQSELAQRVQEHLQQKREELAQQVDRDPPGESDSSDQSNESDLSEPTAPADSLARQQEAAERGDIQEALALMEQDISERSEELRDRAQSFERTLNNLDQGEARKQASEAQRSFGQARDRARDAGKQLDRAQQEQSKAQNKEDANPAELARNARQAMGQAGGDQERARDQLERAAEALASTAEAIGHRQEGDQASEERGSEELVDSSEMAGGFEDVDQSAQSQTSQQAAQRSRQAADSLRMLAQSAFQRIGGQPPGDKPPQGPQGDPDSDPDALSLNETGEKAPDAIDLVIPPELLDLGISAEDWARFEGALSSGSATAIESELPAEYRELVGRYFQVIAKEAGKSD